MGRIRNQWRNCNHYFDCIILIALYFIVKWAVKNGIKEAYTDITGKKPVKDIQDEKELNELLDDTKDR